MTRLLYDVAVITDYSRRKITANEQEFFQRQPPKYNIQDASSEHTGNVLRAKPGQIGMPVAQPQTTANQLPLTSIEEPIINYETANSISDYSSVGTLSSTGTTSSMCSLDLARILWNKVDDVQETSDSSANPSTYETCNQSVDSAMEDTPYYADLMASPSILNLNQKTKRKKSKPALPNKTMFPYFKSSQIQRNTTGEENINSEAIWAKHGQYNACSSHGFSWSGNPGEDDGKISEANLERVAQQLFEFDPQIALSSATNGLINYESGFDQKSIQMCTLQGKSVCFQNMRDVRGHGPDFDHCQNEKTGTQLPQSICENISSADDRWSTACSEWSESFSRSRSNFSSQISNRSAEQDEYITCQQYTNQHVLKNVTEQDTGLGLDGTGEAKDASHIQIAQPSICNASVDRLTKTFASATFLTVNDSGFNNSIFHPNMTNNNTAFSLKNKFIFEGQGDMLSGKASKLQQTGNFEDMNPTSIIMPLTIHTAQDDNSPYHCKVQHGRDFHEFSSFISSNCLPRRALTEKNLSSLLSISQRIVRIRVSKPYMPTDAIFEINKRDPSMLLNSVKDTTTETNASPSTDHYGTGLVFYIDSEQFEVRTHSRIVSSAADAEKTEIQFNVHVPETGQWLRVNCKGQGYGFQTNDFSHTSILTCVTTPALKPLLPFFKNIPIKFKTSLFNDSSYFTDSSREASFSVKDFQAGPLVEKQDVQTINNSKSADEESTSLQMLFAESESSSGHPTESGSVFLNNESESNVDIDALAGRVGDEEDEELSFDQISHSPSSSYELEEIDDEENKGENPFEYCGLEESLVRNAFESVMETHDHSEERDFQERIENFAGNKDPFLNEGGNSVNNWKQCRESNITSLGSRWPTSLSSSADLCDPGHDIPGVKGYQLFDSNAGNVLDTSIQKRDAHINGSILEVPLGKWDHESMLYLQNQRRDYYNPVFKTTHVAHLNNAGPELCVRTKGSRMMKNGSGFQQGTAIPRRSRLNVFNNIHTTAETYRAANSLSNALPNTNSPVLFQSKSNSDLAANFNDVKGTEVCSADDSWDWDLLGLDPKLLVASVSDLEMEKLVDDILSDDSDYSTPRALSKDYLSAFEVNGQEENIALLVAHPHGGFKTASCGKLSSVSNATPDGKLYDLPTCFGCCGAPVLSLDEKGELYVTTIVHNGTTRLGDKGPYRGFGVCHFTQSANEFSQCTTI